MRFDWARFLELARALHQQSKGVDQQEALLRTALSRAYYAGFGHARTYARDWLGFRPRNDPDDHGRLRAHLKSKRRKGDSDRLDRLRQWRNEGDYADEFIDNLPALVVSAIREAELLFISLSPPKRA